MSMRVGVLASFTANPIAAYLGTGLESAGMTAAVEVGPFDQIVQGLLGPSCFADGEPDVIVVWPRFEDIWARGVVPLLEGDSDAGHDQLLDICARTVGQAAASGTTMVLVLPAVPALRPLGVGDAGSVHAVAASATRTREAMRALAAGAPGVLVADAADINQELGRRSADDPRRMAAAAIPYTEEAFGFFADRLVNLLRIAKQGAAKVAVVDADNTLWGGVVGEDGAASIDLADNGPGVSYRQFQGYLRALRRAGLLLALASKNNEDDAWDGFARPEMVLGRDDLASWRVSWKPKSETIADMADELNIGVSAMVFIDDSGAEIAEVASSLPEVRALRMPADPAGWFDAIAASGLLDRLAPTTSDLGRAASYSQETQRRKVRSTASIADYLTSLALVVSIRVPSAADLDRVAQLIAKTNQFTLGTHRHSAAEVAVLMADTSVAVRIVDARDAFGDYGAVGAFVVRGALLDTFVLSCRAMGRGVEDAMLAAAGEIAGLEIAVGIAVDIVETAKNAPLRQWMTGLGATAGIRYALGPVVWPVHIQRMESQQADGDGAAPHD